MKLETELKPGDIVLLKVLACILILFFTLRFLVFPGLEKNQDLQNEKEQVEQTKQEMKDTIKQKSIVEKKIVKQKAELMDASQGFYDLLENQQVDELVTGIALKHNLKPVYLKIEGTEAGVPAAYQTVTQTDESGAQTAKSAQEELDENNQEPSSDTDYEPEVVLQYVNTTTVSMTLQGNESQIRDMLDDIAKNYPGVQVRSFDMNENTYGDSSLQQISQNNCECVLAVYTCGQLGTTASGEEN